MTAPKLLRVDAAAPSPAVLAEAAAALRAGCLVAFPTETVYGLGADARSERAIRRIFAAKGRPCDNPLIVHVDSLEAAHKVTAGLTPLARELAARWWPGPLTLVLDGGRALPAVTTGGLATVAVRVPGHPVALALLRAAGIPVAAPSANRSGRPSPTTAQHVLDDLADDVDVLVDAGDSAVGVESTVVDARGDVPVVLREGAVTLEHLGVAAQQRKDERASPGTRYRHYAPSCAVEIVAPGDGVARASALAAGGRDVALIGFTPAPPPVRMVATVTSTADLAHCLYRGLRSAERAGVDVVVVEAVAETGIGRAVMDRLRRAAAG